MFRQFALGALLLIFVSCSERGLAGGGAGEGPGPQSVSIEQSPDLVRVTNYEPELPVGSWTIAQTPRVQIGQLDGAREYLFQDVVHAQRLDDGSILVVNAGGGTVVRIYSPDGEYKHGFGGQGSGPGEFSWVSAQRATADTILLHDVTLGRSTLASATEGMLRSWSGPSTLTPAIYVSGRNRIWVASRPENVLSEGHHRLYRSFIRGTEEAPGNDTIGYALQGEVVALSEAGDGMRLWPIRVPYTQPATYGFDWVNKRIVVNSRGADLTFIPAGDPGQSQIEVIVAGKTRYLTEGDWRGAVDHELEVARLAYSERCPGCVGIRQQVYEQMTAPEYMPGYDDLVFDRNGNTWARVFESPYEAKEEVRMREWRVISSSGRWVVSCYLPHDVEPFDIGDSYMLARVILDLDVHAVALFDLQKSVIATDARR